MYLVGEPVFRPEGKRERFHAPVGQQHLCLEVIEETESLSQVVQKLREEFLAVLWGLQELGMDFRIIHAHPDLMDALTVRMCLELQCRFAGFTANFFASAMLFPRDFATVFPLTKILLLNPVTRLLHPEKSGWKLFNSAFGEGGSLLYSKDAAVASSRIGEGDTLKRSATMEDLLPLTENGIKVVLFPAPLMGFLQDGEISNRFAMTDHLDRSMALIQDKSGFLHLLLDPLLMTGRVTRETPLSWEPASANETRASLLTAYREIGVSIHLAPAPRVPYGLNFLQVPDGRVLMSGGDNELRVFVESFVGRGKVVTTQVPIRYMPTHLYGGIRCLVGDEPTPLLIPAK